MFSLQNKHIGQMHFVQVFVHTYPGGKSNNKHPASLTWILRDPTCWVQTLYPEIILQMGMDLSHKVLGGMDMGIPVWCCRRLEKNYVATSSVGWIQLEVHFQQLQYSNEAHCFYQGIYRLQGINKILLSSLSLLCVVKSFIWLYIPSHGQP